MPIDGWKDELALNIESIDKQHKQIINILQSLYDALLVHDTREHFQNLCSQLILISRDHFNEEERLMLKFFYPDTEAHIGLHMTFMTIVSTLIGNIRGEQYAYALDNVRYLTSWYIDHILDADRQYSHFVLKNIA